MLKLAVDCAHLYEVATLHAGTVISLTSIKIPNLAAAQAVAVNRSPRKAFVKKRKPSIYKQDRPTCTHPTCRVKLDHTADNCWTRQREEREKHAGKGGNHPFTLLPLGRC